MRGAVHPYSAADTAAAALWLDYIGDAFDAAESVTEADSAAREAIDKLQRRGLIGPGAAALLAEIFDLPECAFA